MPTLYLASLGSTCNDAIVRDLLGQLSIADAPKLKRDDEGDDPDKSLVRWDFDGYCVFGDFEDGRLVVVDLQLPVVG
ncbi:hypothetical protein FXN63_15550 [Pigmentiphaga aceris]|uniref:Uncharacterized protein n=1 Tax=Pigmentiphaga aceris TaxID=1940612 RepID=A0A5C0AY51_9BURK|nr:hypothetical protein [Pigmentiphaga aceris]QEI07095.1 hypothetical protein FXN63_15550 [Pigmentiphaga aceris]